MRGLHPSNYQPAWMELSFRYYSLDLAFLEGLTGKRIAGRTKRDLDEISLRSGTPLSSCRRQFNNLCSVIMSLEDAPENLIGSICERYVITDDLACLYAAFGFLNHNQVSLQLTYRERQLSFADVLRASCYCLRPFLEGRGVRVTKACRETGVRAESIKQAWKMMMAERMHEKTAPAPRQVSFLEGWIADALALGSSLSAPREAREIPSLLVRRVIGPLVFDSSLLPSQLDEVVQCLGRFVREADVIDDVHRPTLEYYMTCLSMSIRQFLQ